MASGQGFVFIALATNRFTYDANASEIQEMFLADTGRLGMQIQSTAYTPVGAQLDPGGGLDIPPTWEEDSHPIASTDLPLSDAKDRARTHVSLLPGSTLDKWPKEGSPMKPLDGISALTLILIASFAIDRVTTWALLVLSAFGVAPDLAETGNTDPRSAKKYKLLYFAFSALLAISIVWLADLRLLSALGVESSKWQGSWLDAVVTVIVLLGGADRVAALIGMHSEVRAAAASDGEQVQVTGKLVVEEQPVSKAATPGR